MSILDKYRMIVGKIKELSKEKDKVEKTMKAPTLMEFASYCMSNKARVKRYKKRSRA